MSQGLKTAGSATQWICGKVFQVIVFNIDEHGQLCACEGGGCAIQLLSYWMQGGGCLRWEVADCCQSNISM